MIDIEELKRLAAAGECPNLEPAFINALCAAIKWGASTISTVDYEATKAKFRDELNAAVGQVLARLEAAESANEAFVVSWTKAAQELKAEGEEWRVDAARYRWLRMRDWFDSPLCVLRDPKRVLTSGIGLGADCPSRDRLDAAIDAELAKERG